MRRILRENGLSIVLFGLFLVFVPAQSFVGLSEYNSNQAQHGSPGVDYVEYVRSLRMRGDEPPDYLLHAGSPARDEPGEIVDGEIVGEFTEIATTPAPTEHARGSSDARARRNRLVAVAGVALLAVVLARRILRRRRRAVAAVDVDARADEAS